MWQWLSIYIFHCGKIFHNSTAQFGIQSGHVAQWQGAWLRLLNSKPIKRFQVRPLAWSIFAGWSDFLRSLVSRLCYSWDQSSKELRDVRIFVSGESRISRTWKHTHALQYVEQASIWSHATLGTEPEAVLTCAWTGVPSTSYCMISNLSYHWKT